MKFPWRAHLEMMRPYTLAYPGMLALAGAVLANRDVPPLIALEVASAACLGWIAGLYSCDAFDKTLDSIAKPSRPLPSGRITTRSACQFMIGYAAIGLLLAAGLSPLCVVLALIVAVLVILYAGCLKARALWGHLCRGCISGTAFLFGMVAAHAADATMLYPIAIALILHDAATNVIGAIRDVDGDRRGGYVTAPVKYGIRASLWLGLAMGGAALAIIFAASCSRPGVAPHQIALLALAAALFAGANLYGLLNAGDLSRQVALRIHNVLIVERLALAAGLMALALGSYRPLALFAAATLFTVTAIVRWRNRYEFAAPPALRLSP